MRKKLDLYETPVWQTHALLRFHPDIRGTVLDPCAGTGAIVRVLTNSGHTVVTSDVDTTQPTMIHGDAQTCSLYSAVGPVDWVVTNPPYRMPQCFEIVAQAVAHAKVGVAMLLRLSFREPTRLRGPWLRNHPVNRLLTLPRTSYTQDGKTDSVTTEWCIWTKLPTPLPPILSLYGVKEIDDATQKDQSGGPDDDGGTALGRRDVRHYGQ